jgi:thioredoxin 2
VIVGCSVCSTANRVPASRMAERAKCARCKRSLLPLARPIALLDSSDFDELVRRSPLPVLVDFWAAWCSPCRMVGPEIEKIASGRPGALIVAKVDTEALPQVAARLGIRSIPTMILFRGGRERERVSGAMKADAIASRLALA